MIYESLPNIKNVLLKYFDLDIACRQLPSHREYFKIRIVKQKLADIQIFLHNIVFLLQ